MITCWVIIGCNNNTISKDNNAISKLDYEGTWNRQASYANGELVSTNPATLILSKDTFSSSGGGCSNSGSLKVDGLFFVMNVKSSSCPSSVNVGTTITSTYSVSGNQLAIINNEYGAIVKEVYIKKS